MDYSDPLGTSPPSSFGDDSFDELVVSAQVLKCRNTRECPGKMSLGGCAAGREGRACNNCKPNHYPKDDGTCAECGPTDFLHSVIFALAALNLFIL